MTPNRSFLLSIALLAIFSAPQTRADSVDFSELEAFSKYGNETPSMVNGQRTYEESWNGANNPRNFSNSYSYQYDRLPLEGSVKEDKIPWSNSFWPSYLGGIAYRWNAWTQPVEHFYKKSPFPYYLSRDTVMNMSPEDIARLSPAEKYDIYMGHYDYPLTHAVMGMVKGYLNSTDTDDQWAGICNGWSPAATHHPEPKPVVLQNKDGITIPFGSADVKALLSHHYAFNGVKTRQLGRKCTSFLGFSSKGCNGVNPGAFHIVLGNQLGIMHEGFEIEIDISKEIWNQPVRAFKSVELDRRHYSKTPSGAANGTVTRVKMRTTLFYADDDWNYTYWNPVMGTEFQHEDYRMYEYWLDLDRYGNIIGGQWIRGSKLVEGAAARSANLKEGRYWFKHERPDFLWKAEVLPFTARKNWDASGLTQIYQH